MGDNKQSGFTIIEVTLFLAITGLLAATLLGGWSVMINTQRYKDSVRTLQSYVQDQYNLVYNVENSRATDLDCNPATGQVTNGTSNRGQTDCVLLGRYIAIEDGERIKVYAIFGVEPTSDARDENATDDVQIRDNYKARIVRQDIGLTGNDRQVPWGVKIVTSATDPTPRNIAIAIVRSPLTGAVQTYWQPLSSAGVFPNIDDFVRPSNQTDLNMCLNPDMPLSGGSMEVRIKAGAASTDAIKVIPDGEGTC